MFRLTRYMRTLHTPTPMRPPKTPAGPVVIWNLVRRCNLLCRHCYSVSADTDFPGELTTEQAFAVLEDLKAFQVPALILSGGEPLMRPDIFEISRRAKALGLYVGLSTNGTLIDEAMIERIAAVGYDYVGISIDGLRETHDYFRRKEGAFDASMHAVELCKRYGIKVGLRFTLTQETAGELPGILKLLDEHDIDKFYLSHLNYAGRGYKNRREDAFLQTTRRSMELLFDHCWDELKRGVVREYVTGNNDADAVFLLKWAERHVPGQAGALKRRLQYWGGNASGVYIANIDNLGNVHPDTFWWNYTLGNVKQRAFSEIWRAPAGDDLEYGVMAGLRQVPRPVKGRCGQCQYLSICGGNTRVRAFQVSGGDAWGEDPACYLDNHEVGVAEDDGRLAFTGGAPVQFYPTTPGTRPVRSKHRRAVS